MPQKQPPANTARSRLPVVTSPLFPHLDVDVDYTGSVGAGLLDYGIGSRGPSRIGVLPLVGLALLGPLTGVPGGVFEVENGLVAAR